MLRLHIPGSGSAADERNASHQFNPAVSLMPPDPYKRVFTATGIAAANAALLSSLFLGISLFIIIFFINKTYTEDKIIPAALKASLAAAKDKREKEDLQEKFNELRGMFDINNYQMLHFKSELANVKSVVLQQGYQVVSSDARTIPPEDPNRVYGENPMHGRPSRTSILVQSDTPKPLVSPNASRRLLSALAADRVQIRDAVRSPMGSFHYPEGRLSHSVQRDE